MADTSVADAQAADADVSQADSNADGSTASQTGKVFDEKYVAELRKEAAQHRKAAKEAADRLKVLEDAKLTEDEKLKKRLAELEEQSKAWDTERAALKKQRVIEKYAAASDALDAEWLADRLATSSGVEVDDEGNPTADSLDKVTKQLRADKPTLFRPKDAGNGSAQAQSAPSTGGSINTQRADATAQTNATYKPVGLSNPALWSPPQAAGKK